MPLHLAPVVLSSDGRESREIAKVTTHEHDPGMFREEEEAEAPLQVREGQRWQDFGNNRPGPHEPAAQKPESPIAWSRAGGRFAKTARPQDAPRRSVLPGLQAAYFRFVIRSRLLYLELLFRSCEWFCDLLKSLWSWNCSAYTKPGEALKS